MEWRTFRDEDLAQIAALLDHALPYDRLSAADARTLLIDDPGFAPEMTFVAERAGRIAGFVVAALPDETLQCPGGIKLFAVAAPYRRRGVATHLFDLAEAALRSRGVTQCVAVNCGNNRLSLGLDVHYTAALCLLLGRGYERTGTTQDMAVAFSGSRAPDLDTHAAERALRERGIIVRRAAPADEAWVTDGIAQGMVPPTPGRRWAYLARQAFHQPEPTIEVAEDLRDHTFLGFAAYDAARRGYLGPMGVLPQAREAGLGTVLLKRCLRDLRAGGYRQGEIFSVGPIPFYARTVGARIFRVFYQYAKTLG